MEHCVAYLTMLGLIIAGGIFLYKEKIKGVTCAGFTIGLLTLFIAFHSIDRLKSFDIAGAKLVLNDMQKTKSDFDNQVAVLSETLSELLVNYTANTGMTAGYVEMVRAGEIARNLLSFANKTNEEIDRYLRKIDGRLLGRYVYLVIADSLGNSVTLKKLNEQDRKNVETKLMEMHLKISFDPSSSKSVQIDDFLKLLKSLNIEEEFYKESIDDMRYFLRTKTLKRPF